MSGFVQVEAFYLAPIMVELPESFPSSFTIDANFGIPGPKGDKGDAGDLTQASIGDLGDVMLTTPQNGDTLIFQSGNFVNTSQANLTDGGNF